MDPLTDADISVPSPIPDNPTYTKKEFKIKDDLIYNKTLPISRIAPQLLESINSNEVSIITAGTGSGKTTQVPQMILDNFEGVQRILVTQPRRIAAISIAKRVAAERNQKVGQQVGFSVRFEAVHPQEEPSITYCTSGLLLRMLHREEALQNVSHIILDEVHERDVDTDLLLMLCRKLVRTHGIRLVLMSATMDAVKLEEYFSSLRVGPILDVDNGNPFPIQEQFLEDLVTPEALTDDTKPYYDQEMGVYEERKQFSLAIKDSAKDLPYELIIDLLERARTLHKSSVLVFMPGWDEISGLHKRLLELRWERVKFHAIHSTVPPAEMDAMFEPFDGCKVIIATNIAESSITIPDVTHVIDSGRQKCMWYDPVAGISRLLPCWASQANLRQRRGRAGRCSPGQYWCLLPRRRVEWLPAQTPPELTRLDLQEVCLNLVAIFNPRLTNCELILDEALDPPKPSEVRTATKELVRLGAIVTNGRA